MKGYVQRMKTKVSISLLWLVPLIGILTSISFGESESAPSKESSAESQLDARVVGIFGTFYHKAQVNRIHGTEGQMRIHERGSFVVAVDETSVRTDMSPVRSYPRKIQIVLSPGSVLYHSEVGVATKELVEVRSVSARSLGRSFRILARAPGVDFDTISPGRYLAMEENDPAVVERGLEGNEHLSITLARATGEGNVRFDLDNYSQIQGWRYPRTWQYVLSNDTVTAEGEWRINVSYLSRQPTSNCFALTNLDISIEQHMRDALLADVQSSSLDTVVSDAQAAEVLKKLAVFLEQAAALREDLSGTPEALRQAEEELVERFHIDLQKMKMQIGETSPEADP